MEPTFLDSSGRVISDRGSWRHCRERGLIDVFLFGIPGWTDSRFCWGVMDDFGNLVKVGGSD